MKPLFSIIIIMLMMTSAFSDPCERNSIDDPACPEKSAEEYAYKIIFAAFAEGAEQLYHAQVFVESIRKFAGSFRNAPVWIYTPQDSREKQAKILEKISSLNADIHESTAPEAALKFYFSKKREI